ncbi:MAG: hypothetical protein EOO44_16310 [Flavobacterium sp.]|nr:MAG: hypothetical protein EOO44_16310 [Flavobacterium sp.]
MFIKSLNCEDDLGLFRIVFLSLLFFFSSYSYAQKSDNPNKIEQVTVVLKDGAKLFSADEAFNSQVNSNLVILKNAEIIQQNNNSATILQATSKEKVSKKDLTKDLNAAVEKKQKEEIEKVEKEINQYKERQKTFRTEDFKGFPSSDEFLASTNTNKDSTVPSYNRYEFSNLFINANSYVSKHSLSYLHTEKFTFYNNKSLDFCFSMVFSTRPPPSYS